MLELLTEMTNKEIGISRKNKAKAWKYFETNYPCLKMIRSISKYLIVLHHKDITLKTNDIDRYIQWNISDLQVMSRSDHQSLHFKNRAYSEKDLIAHTKLWIVFDNEIISLKDGCKRINAHYTSILHRMKRKNQSAQDAFDAIRFGRKRKSSVN